MPISGLVLIFFFYGLAFFSMGMAVTLEMGHGSDARLRHALRPLAVFGVIHGGHEWMEMFQILGVLPWRWMDPLAWESLRIAILALSFLALGAFGASLISANDRRRGWSLLVPIGLAVIWGVGALVLRGRFRGSEELWVVADVWTRYVLAVPSALLACAGLVIQQRAFRQAGMPQYGRDSLWTAAAFGVYGVVGQMFTRASSLPPSTFLNQGLFLSVFGFPVQLLRAMAAIVVAFFVIRLLRSSQVQVQHQLAALQASRLQEAERREAWRGELLKRVVAAQETERQRIARELHDETGQALTAIGLGLRGASATLRQDPDRAVGNLRKLEDLVARAIDELQRVIADLRPSHLDDLGLPAALRWYASELQARTHLSVSVEVLGEPWPIGPTVNTALFRVTQEALTNVVRHAEATVAMVFLEYEPDRVRLRVDDNGKGFDPSVIANPDRVSWGLLGIEERASLLGGKMVLRSQAGRGTSVEVNIPRSGEVRVDDDHTPVAG